ncbi:hypothetical protein DL763_006465 [Monosporascus cannonballus]|nr:hypothetical protein DL763_006465 [Monosporascus cannonballus]
MPSSPESPYADGPRQKPGAACVRCRSKKLKCDSRRPRCSTCIGSNADCEPAAPQVQRGPKKGYLKTLQNKIATLEQQLAETRGAALPTSVAPPPSPMRTLQLDVDLFSMDPAIPEVADNFYCTPRPASVSTELSLNPIPSPAWTGMVPTPHTAGPDPAHGRSLAFGLSPPRGQLWLHRDDRPPRGRRNQVYFERTHQSVPILHRRQYFSWAHSPSKTPAQNCLQHAMWTSAASLSSHLQPLQESLYQATQRLLAASNDTPSAAMSIEYVQARILMSIHDFVHRSHHQAWISAGQCFRIVQLMRLDQLDDPLQPEKANNRDRWLQLEEKRRAFWMAYCLDVLASKRGQWPLTLHEHLRATRLPLPDDAFQNEEPRKMQYLHEFLEAPAQSGQTTLLELIIFCTLSRNIASFERNRVDNYDSIVPTPDLLNHHGRLSSLLDLHTEALQANHPPSLLRSDPILLFTRMFAHALVLCLYSCLKKALPADAEDYHEMIIAWQHRTLKAVFGIMHPFTPLPLAICRDFLQSGQWAGQSAEPQIQELSHLLHDMGSINRVARDSLAESESWPT